MTDPKDLAVRHEPAAQRFVLEIDGAIAMLRYRTVDSTTLDYVSTFTPPALRGGGVASAVTAAALRYARDHGKRVVPTCPFVASYIRRHPEFASLVR